MWKSTQKRVSFFTIFLLFWINGLLANNLQTSNLQIVSVDTLGQYAELSFDVGWDNSWRDATHWDAVWIFVKFQEAGNTGAWQHCSLNYVNGNNDGHTAVAGAEINTPADGRGVFLYRDAIGSGNVNFNGNRLRWNFAADGLTTADFVSLRLYAVEMVYVPQGAFYVGDGQMSVGEIYANFEAGTSGSPFQITSEAGFTLGGGGSGSLGNNNGVNVQPGGIGASVDDFGDAVSQNLPGAFPKGFEAFYCMKYEMTQQQFVDMLNCSTPVQQTFLAATGHFYTNATLVADRYGISESGGVYSTSEPYLPMIFCDWLRAAAYGDWAGLRPMTELEFEKACRGTTVPVVNEYAWGNGNIDLSDNLTLNNLSLPNEGIASGYDMGGINGNAWVRASGQQMQYVARVGVFSAHSGNTGRVSSGATVWGIMEMSGNAWERAVSVGHP
ncbi:MAG TPA: hypothetical protein ENJ82_12835, partial [Bacteroidetes bacterium]|nr:hypothetical protein [Bacteroidota bacterium]